jgi:hypothetical protein
VFFYNGFTIKAITAKIGAFFGVEWPSEDLKIR